MGATSPYPLTTQTRAAFEQRGIAGRVNCPWCGVKFFPRIYYESQQLPKDRVKGTVRVQEFCSRPCMGKYGAHVFRNRGQTFFGFMHMAWPEKESK